ncbi:MAG: efflux transporter outer membrane subunit, partial [Desulfococcus multivorans]|nr:efflux transporter outer membrane subunit [Desulfococcus multivorans]
EVRSGNADADLASWWTAFDDPVLTDLVSRAAAENLDLRQALARLNEARARRGLARTEYYPDLDVSAGASRSRSGGSGDIRESYMAGFDAGWEIDVFGGVRRSVEAAEADLAAAAANLNDVRVSLAAETALSYMEIRTLQARLESAVQNLASQSETHDLVKFRFEAGLTDELALEQARYQLENTRSRVPALRAALDAAKNRLSVLVGQAPGAVDELVNAARPVPEAPKLAASGIPAETLRRRPDIRKAERELAAQTARIGAATADLYPRFTLSGGIGYESAESGDLFTAGSRYWSIGPGVSWKVFDAGAIRRNIEIQNALQEQALIAYEQEVLSALEEVKTAMSAYVEDQSSLESQIRAAESARRAEALARDYYLAGMADFGDVLEAQRAVLSFADQVAESQGAVAADLIRLYKALGGGWEGVAED